MAACTIRRIPASKGPWPVGPEHERGWIRHGGCGNLDIKLGKRYRRDDATESSLAQWRP